MDMAGHKRNYHTLDAIRGIAAIAVVCMHYVALLGGWAPLGAYLAVDVFFLMSGFVLAHAYERRFTQGMTAWQFLRARFVRLYPLYALGSAISVAGIMASLLTHVPVVWSWSTLARTAGLAAVMLPAPSVPGKSLELYPLNMPAWSLLFEMVANAVYVFLFRKLRGRVLIVFIAVGALTLIATELHDGRLPGGFSWDRPYAAIGRVWFSFFAGVLLFRLHRDGRLPRVVVPPILPLIMVIAVLAAAPTGAARLALDLAAVFLVFPAVLVLAVSDETARGATFFTHLGAISYPLYVIHMPVQLFVYGFLRHRLNVDLGTPYPVLGVVVIAGLIAVAWVLARYFDPLARRTLGALLTR